MPPKTPYERQKAVRENKRAAGMVRKEMWVWPSAWPKIKAEADRLNEQASPRAPETLRRT